MNEELEKDIINCSRCGLCMDRCPAYEVKRTETSVSRGKFLQLLGLIRGDLKYDKNLAYNVDLCLSCGKCKTGCPSDIDAVKIFASIKSEHQTPLENFLASSLVFKIKIWALSLFYKLKYPKGRQKPSSFKKRGEMQNVAYFHGCASKAMGFKLDAPFEISKDKFSCCALPYYVKGRFDLYEKYKNKNLKIIEKYDKVVFDCATCYNTVLGYDGVDKDKLIYFTDFYKNLKLKSNNPLKVTFHKPCHLSDEKFLEIEEILKNIENVEYIRMDGAEDCCGFGGDFFIRHPKTAKELSFKKIENVLSSNADVVLTTCPTCLWSLKFGINFKHLKLKAFDLAEFLANMHE